ncbi:hypothetical protein RND71_030807 [Anisodus tanguticus]|uniref:Uncharacterized protein n=1 Tax=Anisodus tanguticus TaxID=243964 RepID=A0AAE1RFW3_9SOLA|nr:hypothetical protein RND71_030807 [Anisodus tanguticus]
MNETDSIGPSKMLKSFIWDPSRGRRVARNDYANYYRKIADEEIVNVSAVCQSSDAKATVSHFVPNLDDHDELLHSCCPKVLVEAPSDSPIEIPDEEATSPDCSDVQQFDECFQRYMPERYITATSLDRGSSERQIEFEPLEDMYLADFFMEPETIADLYLHIFFMENEDGIPTSEMTTDEMIRVVEHEKSNGGVEHDADIVVVVSVLQIAFSMKLYDPCNDFSTIVVDDFKEIRWKSACHIDNIFTNQHL